jgi:hypothetical protein
VEAEWDAEDEVVGEVGVEDALVAEEVAEEVPEEVVFPETGLRSALSTHLEAK